MPRLKVELEQNETSDQAEELIFKAFSSQRDGSIHQEEFHDPVMRDLVLRLQKLHADQYQALLAEIGEILDSEFSDGNLS